MRKHGRVNSAHGHVPDGHLCWAYHGRAEFRARAIEYLLDGIAAGQWIEYVGTGSRDALRSELAGYDGLSSVLDTSGIAVTPVEDFYAFQPDSTVVDPDAAVTARVAATKQALADGYTGFRAVVDATALVTSPLHRQAFAQFEYLIDQTMSTLPVTALCGYNLDELGSAAVAELACLHPLTNLETTFQLYTEHDNTLALTGALDHHCAELFTQAIGHALALNPEQELVLNGNHLTSIETHTLLTLERLARENERRIVLRSAPPPTTHLITQLELTHVVTSEMSEHTCPPNFRYPR